ncbi:Hypothetical protein PBC10988_36150 [Planctomycetales bacterium 10988]|nr:Hypothetical protein PBC10988_36150 [Planctomycetales bacterium 10988]
MTQNSEKEAFDPYHKWLGIRNCPKPPNHYRLLGLEPFEDDLEVIAEAADRQMGHIRTHQSGKYAELSQKLLNELARAKICLLNPKRRSAYDEKLKETLEVEKQGTDAYLEALPLTATDRESVEAPNRSMLSTSPRLTSSEMEEDFEGRTRRPSPLTIQLTVTQGPDEGASYRCSRRKSFTVGRSEQADFSLPEDLTLSRVQFTIRVNPPVCILRHMSDRKTTQLNEELVSEAVLKDGDIIQAGQQTVIRVEISQLLPS